MAGVALGHIRLPFAWLAWHSATSACHLRGRRGTGDTGLGLVARLDRIGRAVMPRHFAWQAWHLETSNGTLRGRRGTWRHPTALCVAGVAHNCVTQNLSHNSVTHKRHSPAFCVAGVALIGTGWRAWTGLVADDAAALCVAGVALGDTLRGRHGTW